MAYARLPVGFLLALENALSKNLVLQKRQGQNRYKKHESHRRSIAGIMKFEYLVKNGDA